MAESLASNWSEMLFKSSMIQPAFTVSLLDLYHIRVLLVEGIIVRDNENLFEAPDVHDLLRKFFPSYLIHILGGSSRNTKSQLERRF